MQINKIQNQPSFQANFSNDSTTRYVLQEVRKSARTLSARNALYNSFNAIKQTRRIQTFELFFTEDAKIIAARKPENFWDSIFGKNVLLHSKLKKVILLMPLLN